MLLLFCQGDLSEKVTTAFTVRSRTQLLRAGTQSVTHSRVGRHVWVLRCAMLWWCLLSGVQLFDRDAHGFISQCEMVLLLQACLGSMKKVCVRTMGVWVYLRGG